MAILILLNLRPRALSVHGDTPDADKRMSKKWVWSPNWDFTKMFLSACGKIWFPTIDQTILNVKGFWNIGPWSSNFAVAQFSFFISCLDVRYPVLNWTFPIPERYHGLSKSHWWDSNNAPILIKKWENSKYPLYAPLGAEMHKGRFLTQEPGCG